MSRWHKKKDGAQNRVVAALRARRCQVYDTHAVGESFPDLVVLFPGKTIIELPGGRLRVFDGALVMVEVKTGRADLEPGQADFRKEMGENPPYLVMRTGEEDL